MNNNLRKNACALLNSRGFEELQDLKCGAQLGWTYRTTAASLYLENHGLAGWDISNNRKQLIIKFALRNGATTASSLPDHEVKSCCPISDQIS